MFDQMIFIWANSDKVCHEGVQPGLMFNQMIFIWANSDKVCHEGVQLVADKESGSAIDGFLNNVS